MHKLHKQILSIDYFEESTAMAFQDRARDSYYKSIIPEMEALLKKYDHRQGIIKIDRIELELGQITEENFEKEWTKRFKEQFEKELAQRIKLILNNQSGNKDSLTPLWQEDQEILEHFLLHASLPWYRKGKKTSPADALRRMLEKQPDELILLIKKHASNKKVIKRIVLQFAENQVVALIKLLEPKEADFIISTIGQIDETHHRKPIVQHRSAPLKKELWEFALTYILVDRGSYFNTKDYMRSMIFALADSYGLERIQLVELIYLSVEAISKEYSYQTTFRHILTDIYHEHATVDKPYRESKTEDTSRSFKELIHFIAHGSVPLPAKTSKTQLAQLYHSWLGDGKNRTEILTALKKAAVNTAAIERLSKLTVNEKQFAKLLQFILPTEADFIADWSVNLQKIQEEKQIFPTERQVFRQEKFFLILTILLTDRGSAFNRKSFVKQLLHQLSRKYNVALPTFIRHILDSLDEQFSQISEIREIRHLLKELMNESVKTVADQKEKKGKQESAGSALFIKESILFWATYQKQPWWIKSSVAYQNKSFGELWDMFIKSDSTLQLKLISPLLKNDHALEFLLAKLTPTQLEITLKLINKPLASKLLLYQEINLQMLQRDSGKKAKSHSMAIVQWRFTLKYLADSRVSNISIENYLQQATAYFPFLFNLTADEYLTELDTVLKKSTGTDHRLLQTALSKSTPRLEKNPKKGENIEKQEEVAAFIKQWQNKPHSALDFQHALFLELNRLYQKPDKKIAIRLLNTFFSPQSMEQMLLYTKHEPLVKLVLEILLNLHFHKGVQQFKEIEAFYKISYSQASREAQTHHLKALIMACMQQDFSEEGLLGNYLRALGRFSKKQPEALVKQAATKKNGELLLKNKIFKKLLAQANTGKPEKEELVIPYKEETEETPIESIAVHNAGAILLWPFISTFFQRLDMLKEKQFSGKESQQRAVHLWQYLVTEQSSTGEEKLSLLKLLCGLPIAEPIVKEIDITADEKALCDSLLQGVITQWAALKNTSPAALRETFLQREGMLYQKEKQWELHIEQKAFDVLLDQLPWGLQFIKLPWMETTLYTKWR